jgi:myosin heavy subunit
MKVYIIAKPLLTNLKIKKHMKKTFIIVALATTALLFSCQDGSKQPAEAPVVTDSTLVDEPLANQEVEDMVNLINQVAGVLDSIQIQEKVLFKAEEGDSKQQVLERMSAFKDLLARKQAEINKLAGANKSNKLAIANLQKMVDFLNQQLEEKTARITELEDLVTKKDVNISELRYNVNQLSEESEYLKDQNFEQDQQLNAVYYIVAEKKELKEMGLLEGGMLSKKRANYANIDQSKFTKKDMRGFQKLVIESKSPKLITDKPESSYTLTKNDDGTTTLEVTDAKAFWSASPYLIIQK